MRQPATEQMSWSAGRRGRRYALALLALGLSGGVALAQEAPVQAIDPVNVNGSKKAPPEAAVPTVAPPASMPAVSSSPARPAAASPNGSTNTTAPAAAPVLAEPPVQAVTPAKVGESPASPAAPSAAVPQPVAAPAAPAAATPAAPAAVPAAAATPAPATPPAAGTPSGAGSAAAVQPPVASPATQNAADLLTYPISELKVAYYRQDPQQPPIAELMARPVTLGVANGAYTAARPGEQTVSVKLSEVGKRGITKITRSGISAIYSQIVRFYNDKGISGVFVVVDSKDIDAADHDIRPAGHTSLQLIVVISVVHEIRTVATGDVKGQERVDLPQYNFILKDSPIQPEGKTGGKTDLFNRNVLDDYVMQLSRQPGRRVDVAVSGTEKPGEVNLDYLVSESKPWYVYAQASNTGTRETNPWRERFGAVDNQLTGHDDILTIDYVTAGFWASHAVIGSYELPIFDIRQLRYKIYATYNQFTASDVGINNENFTGSEWEVGNEVAWNFFQQRELFADVIGGFRYQPVEADNKTTAIHGEGNFYVPYVGLKLDRQTEIATTTAQATLVSYLTDSSASDMEGLGRTQPSTEPLVLQFQASQSAYLEPLLFPQQFVEGKSTLAHELYVGVQGQYAFDYRVFPQAEDVAGGFYTVRGYPESVVAGDSVVVATGEYRFHLPRILPIQSDPSKTPFLWDKSFRFSPSQIYGRPDWDFITRAFVDVAQVDNNRRLSFESNYTLVGTGVGVELQYKQNLNIRVDWGIALQEIPGLVEQGSNRFHISATLLY